MAASPPAGTGIPLSRDELRWLHDKYERLATEEAQLAGSRTSYFAAIGTVLITALVVATADLFDQPVLYAVALAFLSVLGILISVVWAILLHRTNDAQNLWREAAADLETLAPPVASNLPGPITLRSGEELSLDLTRPYLMHRARFAPDQRISWQDRVAPDRLTEILPLTFLAIWIAVLVLSAIWFALHP
ncbi:MAG TPA: hypothetical protein VEL82_05785 [Thermoplasmata archaeon]|nr:hypothetical protein [Thermoplasmata archaeon]